MVNKPKCHKMSRVLAAAGLFVALLITACDSAPAVTSDADAKAKSSNHLSTKTRSSATLLVTQLAP